MLGHCDFFEQVSEASENGRLTPDMIVRLPGDRRVVVDAKAPRMYLEGLADRTEAERSQYLRDHAAKVRAHMTLLSGKRYWEQFAPTPEFVVMFLPDRGVIRGGAAGRSGPAGIRRRQESDSGQPADADRAAASGQLRMEAGVARARCVEDSGARKRAVQLRAGACRPSVEDAKQPGRYRAGVQRVGWLGRAQLLEQGEKARRSSTREGTKRFRRSIRSTSDFVVSKP